MLRLLERLDGRRSRNSSLGSSRSKSNSKSRNNTRNNHNRNNHNHKKHNDDNDDDDDGRHSLHPKDSLSQSYDTADTDIEEEEYITETALTTTTTEGSRTTLLWLSPENTQSFSAAASAILQRKGVTWADQPTATTGGNSKNNSSSNSDKHLVTRYTYTPLPEQYLRIVILLLHPVEVQYEFVHAEYDTDVRLTVAQVLQQLGSMAVSPALQQLEWNALCLRDTQREMINCMTLQEYNLYDGSMLIAVPMDTAPKIVLEQAGFFLKDKVLRRMVRRAKMTGQSPQRLQANPESNNNCKSNSDTSDTDEDDDNSTPQLPSAEHAPVPSSLSFDASVVVTVPSIQDDDFDDFWGRVDDDDDHVHATVTNTPATQKLADHTLLCRRRRRRQRQCSV
jgi:hypothetical protein